MRKLIAVLVVIMLLTIAYSSIAQETNKNAEFLAAQKIYQAQSLSISLDYDAKPKMIVSEYAKELDVLEQTLAKKGNLDGVMIVRQEKADFKLANEIPDTVNDKTPAELKAVREKYKGMLSAVEVDKKREIGKLAMLYVGRLQNMQEALTKALKIDDALLVKNEIDQVKGSVALGVEEKGKGVPVQQPNEKPVDTIPSGNAISFSEAQRLVDSVDQLSEKEWLKLKGVKFTVESNWHKKKATGIEIKKGDRYLVLPCATDEWNTSPKRWHNVNFRGHVKERERAKNGMPYLQLCYSLNDRPLTSIVGHYIIAEEGKLLLAASDQEGGGGLENNTGSVRVKIIKIAP